MFFRNPYSAAFNRRSREEHKMEEQAKLNAILSRYDRKEDERELAELKRRQKEAREKADKEREVRF
jgi:hypothetical protein